MRSLGSQAVNFGFAIRNVERRLSPNAAPGRELPRSVQQLTELIGRVPLKDIVRETTDVIERLCIEAALNLTGDNRASASEMLGLSRQSLYVKLRRFGLADLPAAARPKANRVRRCPLPASQPCWNCSSRSPGFRRCGPSVRGRVGGPA